MSKKEKVLVTGATGFIASHLVESLVGDGFAVVATGRPSADATRLSGVMDRVQYEPMDLCDPDARRSLFGREPFTAIYHLAADGLRANTAAGPNMLAVNVVATVELARLACTHDVRHFVQVGSGFEYEPADHPINESARLKPTNFYGATKSAASLILHQMVDEIDLPLITFRPFSVYGPNEAGTRFIPYVIKQALCNRPLELTSCSQIRDYLFVTDVVAALRSVLFGKAAIGECYNLGGGVDAAGPISRIVEEVMKCTGTPLSLARFGAIERARPEPSYFVADTAKAKAALGWQPQVSVSAGLTQTVAWYRQRY